MDYKTFVSTLARKMGCGNDSATKFVEDFVTLVRDECGNTNRLAIPGFGSFEGIKRDETIIRDLTTGKKMLLPPSIELQFTPGGMLRKKVKEGMQ